MSSNLNLAPRPDLEHLEPQTLRLGYGRPYLVTFVGMPADDPPSEETRAWWTAVVACALHGWSAARRLGGGCPRCDDERERAARAAMDKELPSRPRG